MQDMDVHKEMTEVKLIQSYCYRDTTASMRVCVWALVAHHIQTKTNSYGFSQCSS